MEQVYCSLAHNETWILANLSHCYQPLSTKWVYRLKASSDSTPMKYKIHLVACRNE